MRITVHENAWVVIFISEPFLNSAVLPRHYRGSVRCLGDTFCQCHIKSTLLLKHGHYFVRSGQSIEFICRQLSELNKTLMKTQSFISTYWTQSDKLSATISVQQSVIIAYIPAFSKSFCILFNTQRTAAPMSAFWLSDDSISWHVWSSLLEVFWLAGNQVS